jgi:hypothetical protein
MMGVPERIVRSGQSATSMDYLLSTACGVRLTAASTSSTFPGSHPGAHRRGGAQLTDSPGFGTICGGWRNWPDLLRPGRNRNTHPPVIGIVWEHGLERAAR